MIEALFTELHPPLAPEEAVAEADRCLECGGPYEPAPCVAACPADVDVPKFIREILDGDIESSARTIFSANVFGGSCARVCPVEELCEGACVLKEEGRRPVAIGRLQRFSTDWALEKKVSYLSRGGPKELSIGVIGAGPAGLTCAAELAKLGYQVTVYESYPDFGGLITRGIAPYKQHIEPIPQEVEAIKGLGVKLQMGVTVGREIGVKELEKKHDAIFLGVGMGEDIEISWEGDGLDGIHDSLEFIEELNLGDPAKLKIGERVAVIGGGNTAIDAAREAVRLGAREVVLLYRRTEEQMPAYRHEVEQAWEEGVHFYWLTAPKRFTGDHRLKAIECIHMKLGSLDRSGRPRPEPVEGTEFTLPVDMVIKAIGQQGRKELLEQIDGLKLDRGLVKIDEKTGQTANPRYFAGGDCVNGGNTVVQAVHDGKLAAQGIHHYLAK